MYTTLIEPEQLAELIEAQAVEVLDCRFRLEDPEAGEQLYMQAHIPRARYAHLNRDLSGPIIPGSTGRHPLPDPQAFAEVVSHWGISNTAQVVAYDDAGGTIAARCWWMFRWVGHSAIAVLNGGWPAWLANNLPQSTTAIKPSQTRFHVHPNPALLASATDVLANLQPSSAATLIDVRAQERYLGIVEPLDTRGGHIPGARNLPYGQNLDSQGRFHTPEVLQELYTPHTDAAIVYCGSGVTAAHTVLAHAHAGLPLPRLYAGSWSEWITDSNRPIAQGKGA